MPVHSAKLATLVASGFGVGYAKSAPGTRGSLACLFIWLLATWGISSTLGFQLAFVAAMMALAWWSVPVVLQANPAQSDPQFIVIDEWVGMSVALVGTLAGDFTSVLILFLLFRLFDTWKPWLVGRAEQIPGALGVIADDIVAGVFALVTHQVLLIGIAYSDRLIS